MDEIYNAISDPTIHCFCAVYIPGNPSRSSLRPSRTVCPPSLAHSLLPALALSPSPLSLSPPSSSTPSFLCLPPRDPLFPPANGYETGALRRHVPTHHTHAHTRRTAHARAHRVTTAEHNAFRYYDATEKERQSPGHNLLLAHDTATDETTYKPHFLCGPFGPVQVPKP